VPKGTLALADREPVIQRKLTVGAANDPLEAEADRIAAQVLARLSAPPEIEADAGGRVQRVADTSVVSAAPGHGLAGGDVEPDVARRVQRSAGGGSPIGAAVRADMERGFGADFAGVRIHADAESDELNRALNARAFTAGSDIYFGAGQYRPDTAGGQELLAHELTHTLQQGSSRVQRSALPAGQVTPDTAGEVRRWDLKSGVDVSKATKIRTIPTGQAVFMLKDGTGEEIVIKAENYPMGLMQLATLVHESVHDVDVIDSHPVDAGQKAVLQQKIGDPAVTSDSSWSAAGLNFAKFKTGTDDDAAAARKAHQQQVGGLALAAQAFAKGDDAKKQAKSTDPGSNLRAMFSSPKYMRQIGAAAAADMFTGNADRAGGVTNLGNWVTTANERIQLIDNMDNNAKQSFGKEGDDLFGYDLQDWGANPEAFYASAVKNLLFTARDQGDPGIVAWADADGGFTRRFMIEDYKQGFADTVARIVKLYGTDKGSKAGRAVKKDVKALENDGLLDFWEVLKARARYMQDPKKGPALKKQVLSRQKSIDKKAAKKK
jgi:hypothetical protein